MSLLPFAKQAIFGSGAVLAGLALACSCIQDGFASAAIATISNAGLEGSLVTNSTLKVKEGVHPTRAEIAAEFDHLVGTGTNPVVEPINLALRNSQGLVPSSNLKPTVEPKPVQTNYQAILDEAVRFKQGNNNDQAEKLFIRILQSPAPVELQKTALLEMAVVAQEKQELARAQQIYAQFLAQYPGDPSVPEVLLRQGLLYRQLGAPVLALSKFYSVMSTALNLKADRLSYYQRLVLLAQSEIAETYYLQGKYDDASEFFGRLLKLDTNDLDKSKIHYKQLRSLSLRARYAEVINSAGVFLNRYPEAETTSEVRFLLADALKKQGRNREAMEQVLALLETQQKTANQDSKTWNYWRQRTGNEIANQLYQEGDYLNALQVYLSLANLSESPDWQLPALYQAGLVYERLRQTQKASETYGQIITQQGKLGTNASNPSLVAVLDMAKWRKDFLGWQEKADASNRQLNPAESVPDTQ